LKLRVFVASPQDVATERQGLHRKIEVLNRMGNAADDLGVVLEVLDWHTHVAPIMGRPEAVIIDQIPVETWDIFIGILWMRFGMPTGATDGSTHRIFDSGTEEEFALAHASWRTTGRPKILFYQCVRAPQDINEIDPDQFGRVRQFFGRFAAAAEHPGLVRQFRDLQEFEDHLSRDLLKLLRQITTENSASPPDHDPSADAAVILEDRIRERMQTHFKAGQVYPMSLMSIDIVGHSALVKRYPREGVKVLLDSFRKLVCVYVDQYEGGQIDWASDGGLFAFYGQNRCEKAVLAGIQVLQALTTFNLNQARNPLPEPIQIRVAADDGLVEFQWPTSNISSEHVNFVVHLEKGRTRGGEFCISEELYKNLSDRLRKVFSYRSRFEQRIIYVYPSFTAVGRVSADDIGRLLATLRTHVGVISGVLDSIASGGLNATDHEALSSGFDFVYTTMEQFCRWFSDIDDRWASEYLQSVARYTAELLDEERKLWEGLHKRYVALPKEDRAAEDLRAILQVGGSRRSLVVAELGQLGGELQSRIAGTGRAASEPGRTSSVPEDQERKRFDLLRKVNSLIGADDLEEEAAFAEVVLCDRRQLAEVILSEKEDARSQALAESLWMVADLVLLEDNSSRMNPESEPVPRLFETLIQSPGAGWKFKTLQQLLFLDREPSLEFIMECAKPLGDGREMSQKDVHVIWLSLIVAHPNTQVRDFATAEVEFDRVWRTIAYPRAPIHAILAIQKRLKHEGGEDRKKIFFDCVRARVAASIETVHQEQEMEDIKRLILGFFNFDFFVQTGYFERLDDLLSRFLKKAEQFRWDISSFREIMKKLDQERVEKGNPSATLPEGIGRVPLAIQRRFAKEGLYLDFFVLHPDDRIARETLNYINAVTFERVILYRNINRALLAELLRRPEASAKRPILLLALHHPKCDPGFAARNMNRLSRQELEAIVRDAGASSEVRQRAQNLLKQKK